MTHEFSLYNSEVSIVITVGSFPFKGLCSGRSFSGLQSSIVILSAIKKKKRMDFLAFRDQNPVAGLQ